MHAQCGQNDRAEGGAGLKEFQWHDAGPPLIQEVGNRLLERGFVELWREDGVWEAIALYVLVQFSHASIKARGALEVHLFVLQIAHCAEHLVVDILDLYVGVHGAKPAVGQLHLRNTKSAVRRNVV